MVAELKDDTPMEENPWNREAYLVPEQQFSPKADKRPRPIDILPLGLMELADRQQGYGKPKTLTIAGDPPDLVELDWHTRWLAWNNMSPEFQFCLMAAWLTKRLQWEFAGGKNPQDSDARGIIVLETGMGQGYVTRAVLRVLRRSGKGIADKMITYETMQMYADLVPEGVIGVDGLEVRMGTPGAGDVKGADLVILDSNPDYRNGELRTWIEEAKQGSRLLIHDTFHHESATGQFTSPIMKAQIDGMVAGEFIDAPRGWYSGVHR